MIKQEIVPIDKIWWKDRYRKDFGDMNSLVESIKDKGIIQAITITDEYELLSGERRITAAQLAGLKEIPALIRPKGDIIDSREVELIENLIRKDWEWHERAMLTAEIDRLYRDKGMEFSQRKLGELLNKSQMSISRDLTLAKSIEIIPELKEMKTADEALKVIGKMEERAIIGELRNRQVEQVATGEGLAKGLQLMLKLADSNYQIGDTLQKLLELPSGGEGGFTRFHVIECDPPYGIDLGDQKRSKDDVTSNVHSYEEVEKDQYPTFIHNLAKELYRVAGGHTWLVFWYGPTWHGLVHKALNDAGWKVDDIPCIWYKSIGQTMQPKYNLGRTYEPFFLCRKGVPNILKEGRGNVFVYPGVPGTKKYHPTERPVAMIEDILGTLAAPRSNVLIPFLGSGATLRAAYNSGMSGTGWDINTEYKDKFMLKVEEDTNAIGNNEGDNDDTTDEDDADASGIE